jgi:hypothetical protein
VFSLGSGPRLYTESHVAAESELVSGHREWSQERKLDRSRVGSTELVVG